MLALSAISRQPDKFVSFDNDAEVPNLGPIDCSLPPRQPLVDDESQGLRYRGDEVVALVGRAKACHALHSEGSVVRVNCRG